MRFADRIAVVTGGASGIGRATAERLAAEGAHVVVFDVDGTAATAVAQSIRAEGGRSTSVIVDVSDDRSVADGLRETIQHVGVPTVLVNNAGILHVAPALETTVADFDRILRINLRSVFIVSTAFAREWRDRGLQGSITNLSSIHAVLSEPNASAYTATKGGIEAMSRTFASEWAALGIRVNCVRPGATRTALTDALYTPEILAALASRIPMTIPATPEQIAAGVCFLASDDASYCTGTVLDVDGGYIMDGSLPSAVYR